MKTITMKLYTFVIIAITTTVGVTGVENTTMIQNIEIVIGATSALLLAKIYTKTGQIHFSATVVAITHIFAQIAVDFFELPMFMNIPEMIFAVSAMIPPEMMILICCIATLINHH